MAITTQDWDKYKSILDDFWNDIAGDSVIWRHTTIGIDRYQEGNKTNEDTTLKALFEYPFQRKWGIDVVLPEGHDDRMYAGLYLNYTYLSSLGLISDGKFNFNSALDRFYCRGQWFKCFGDTPAAQAYDRPLYIILILERTDEESVIP